MEKHEMMSLEDSGQLRDKMRLKLIGECGLKALGAACVKFHG